MIGEKSTREKQADTTNFTIIYIWLLLLSLGLGLGLGLYATHKVNPQLRLLKDMSVMTETVLNSFITNTTQGEIIVSGTADVAIDSEVLGQTAYRIKQLMLGDLKLSYLEIDAFSFDVTMSSESSFILQIENFNPSIIETSLAYLGDQFVLALRAAVDRVILPMTPTQCFITNPYIVTGLTGATSLEIYLGSGNFCGPPFTVGLRSALRILYQVS